VRGAGSGRDAATGRRPLPVRSRARTQPPHRRRRAAAGLRPLPRALGRDQLPGDPPRLPAATAPAGLRPRADRPDVPAGRARPDRHRDRPSRPRRRRTDDPAQRVHRDRAGTDRSALHHLPGRHDRAQHHRTRPRQVGDPRPGGPDLGGTGRGDRRRHPGRRRRGGGRQQRAHPRRPGPRGGARGARPVDRPHRQLRPGRLPRHGAGRRSRGGKGGRRNGGGRERAQSHGELLDPVGRLWALHRRDAGPEFRDLGHTGAAWRDTTARAAGPSRPRRESRRHPVAKPRERPCPHCPNESSA